VPEEGTYGWTLQYFQNFTEYAESYKVHNEVLKFIRDYSEACNDNPARMLEYGFRPNFQDKVIVPVVKHAHKSPDYDFDWDKAPRKWHWHQMVAMLHPESMRYVVEGDQQNGARSRGLVSCELVQMDRYDHKRHHKDPSMEGDLKVWDFVLFRNDGSCIALHPEYRSKKIACTRGMPVTDLEIPKHGRGGSDGEGTFKYFKNRQADTQLRFAASKEACAPAPQSRPAPPPATTMPGPPAPPPPAPPAVADKQHSLMALRDKYRRVEYDKTQIGLSTAGTHPENRGGLYPCGHRCKALAVDVVGKVGSLKECVEHFGIPQRVKDDVAVVEEPSPGITRSREEDNAHGVSSSNVTWSKTLEEVQIIERGQKDPQGFMVVAAEMAAMPQSRGKIADSEMASPAAFAEANPASYQRSEGERLPVPQANPASDAKAKPTSVADAYLRNVNARGVQ
jgi:hypothetical protein